MPRVRLLPVLVIVLCACALSQQPFLPRNQWLALRDESSGAVPYENLRYLTTLHRVPATADYDKVADYMLQKAKEYGLADAHAEQFPIDGLRTYGLMRSYFAWKVAAGELWEVRPQHALIADWKTEPIRLADYSRAADVEALLVDVGRGTSTDDYANKDVKGKIVLADGVLARVQAMAVARYGAAGILSDMPNQSTAWSGLDPTLVRWGHLNARQPAGFAFMISRQAADTLRSRLNQGEHILLQAHVQAEVGPGHWTVITGTVPGSDPSAGEVVYSCHLDHERPGANDNGSGCVTILESARVLSRLIGEGTLPRPRRTLRFVWGPEVEGTMAFLASHPEIKEKLRADIHMDMVGGDPFQNKSVFHVSATPWSLPSFVTDVGASFLETIQAAAANYAENGGSAVEGIVEARAGTRNQLIAGVTPYSAGSDHDDYDSSTIAVPSLYLRDWPDIYIHTDHDSLAQIDPTKLKRVALLGAASGYVYATMDPKQLPSLLPYFASRAATRLNGDFSRAEELLRDPNLSPSNAWYEARNTMDRSLRRERAALNSLLRFVSGPTPSSSEQLEYLDKQSATLNSWLDSEARKLGATGAKPESPWANDATARRIPVRVGEFGPLTFQNDNVLLARLGSERYSKIKLPNSEATPMLRVNDQSELYAYEIVNFVDGKRSIGEIRDAVSAEYGPLPVALVADYLDACSEGKIIEWRKPEK
jgi:aminopeptidase YwaD